MANPIILVQVILQGLMLGASYGLISLSMTLIFATTHLFNFAHGSYLAIAMYICFSLYTAIGLDPYISILITTPVMFIFGWVLFRGVIQRVLKAHMMMAAQVCLGLMWVFEAILSTIYGHDVRSVPTFLGSSKVYLGPLVISSPYVVTFIMAAVVGIALYWLYQKTDFGRSVRAVIQNRDAAALMGIRVTRIQTAVFALGLALLGFCGPVIIPMVPISPSSGMQFTMFAFMIMIFGGTNNLLGSVVGGLLFGVIDSLGRYFFTGYIAAIIPYAALVLVLIFRPQGLLGEK